MSTGLVVGGSHTPAGARAPGGRGPLTQLCPPSPLLVRDTELGTSFPRVGFPAVPWGGGGDGHCQIARPRRPESHEAGSRWNSGSKRANGWLSDRGRGAPSGGRRGPAPAREAPAASTRRRLPRRPQQILPSQDRPPGRAVEARPAPGRCTARTRTAQGHRTHRRGAALRRQPAPRAGSDPQSPHVTQRTARWAEEQSPAGRQPRASSHPGGACRGCAVCTARPALPPPQPQGPARRGVQGRGARAPPPLCRPQPDGDASLPRALGPHRGPRCAHPQAARP